MFFHNLLFLYSFLGLLLLQFVKADDDSSYQWQDQFTNNAAPDWQKYVRAPAKQVRPAAILANYTQGNVTNPEGLLGRGSTTLTRFHLSAGTNQDIPPTIVVDFGQNIVGVLSIKFNGAQSFNSTPGLPGIRLAFSETLEYLTNVSDFSRSYNGDAITPGSDQIAVKSRSYTWTDVHGCEHGNQVCVDGLHGFRYVKIYLDALPSDAPYTTSYGSVSIDSMSLDFSGFLGTHDTFTGWFQSSDEQLNQWWYDGVYTTDMCTDTFNINDTEPRGAASPSLIGKLVIHDGAKRDRDPYVGDLAVSSRTSYLSRNVSQATRDVLADLADHQRSDGWIPPASINDYTLPLLDYPLWWVVCSYDLVMYTGDVAYIQKYYSNLLLVLDTFYPSVTDTQTQLITKGTGVSAGYGDYGFLPRNGPVTYYNALYVLALNNAASIAGFLDGKQADADRWTARAQSVSAALNKYNFDTANGAFFDGTCGSTYCQTHAQDGNSLSIVSGATTGTRANQILSYLSSHNARPYGNSFYDNDVIGGGFSQRVYAFISYFEIEARFIVGSASSALEEIRRLYGWMSSHDPMVTQWEGIGQNGSPYEGAYTSMAHGWGTGIVPALTNYILGVIPQGPGFSIYTIRPVPGDVSWAKGQVPTPYGPIKVSWYNNPSKGQFYIRTVAPAGCEGIIYVPVANSNVPVYLDSKPVSKSNETQANQQVGYFGVPIKDDHTHVITVGFQTN